MVAVARYSSRGKQYLTMIRPAGDGLVLEQLLYPNELRSLEEVPQEDGSVDPAELELAKQLIANATAEDFDPAPYKDEVKERVQELVALKIEGEQITVAPQERPETKIIDLMEALQASLGAQEPAAGTTEEPLKKAATG